ncbi:MAG: hypothetical protein HC923_03320 [Myxococcales bacterium]|nr:hypothetical protein [Myxococcales bacterium]
MATEARMRAEPAKLSEAQDFLQDLTRFWTTQLDSLEKHLEEMNQEGGDER